MLFADDEDASLKTPVVRPNDILGIEISPQNNANLSRWQYNCSGKETPRGPPVKPKLKGKKVTGDCNSNGALRTQSESPMKRGDPFLPSVFPDENPIADYNVKKNSRKKPSDCKCKGFGYNLSPSALLPEEMRQQWGAGVFGKPTVSRLSVIPNSPCCSNRDIEPTCVQPSVVRTGDACSVSSCCVVRPTCVQPSVVRTGDACSVSSCCVVRCKNCMKDPCVCSELCSKHDGFRIPETSVTRKHKSSTKGHSSKGKENNSLGSVLLGSTNSVSVLKRVTFYNSKDNNNIISTSNFHRNSASSLSMNGHGSPAAEVNGYRSRASGAHGGSGFPRPITNGNPASSTNKFIYSTNEDFVPTPRNRQLHQPAQHRHHASSPPILATAGLRVPSGVLEVKAVMSRGSPQLLVLGGQGCSCDSCRQRASLMSKMEELGFSPSHAQQMLPPFMLEASQRFHTGGLRSVLAPPGRYAPYNVPIYGYAQVPRNVYCSPERHQCRSPPVYDYNDIPSVKSQPTTSTPLSTVKEINKSDTSCLDNDNAASPPFSGFGEDIIDLSIKDTVDFFVSMKSPFVTFSLTTKSDICSGTCSSTSSREKCVSPSYSSTPNSWFSTAGMCAASYSMSSVQQDNSYRDPPHQKLEIANGQMQSMSLLYSSLVSDLEDELRCAIENIPIS